MILALTAVQFAALIFIALSLTIWGLIALFGHYDL